MNDIEPVIDINELDTYLYNEISFSGKEILNWCKLNKDSDNFDYKYASNEIYNNYFKEKSLKLNAYYYILYADCLIRDDMYYIKRDLIMSPKYNGKSIKYRDLRKLTNSLNDYIAEIISLATIAKYDINIMYNRLDKMGKRLSKLGIYNTDQNVIKEAFQNSSNYRRYQIYTIIESAVLDLTTIISIIKNITDRR